MTRTRSRSPGRTRSLSAFGTGDHTFRYQTLKGRRCGDAQQTSNRYSAVGDDHLLSFSGSVQPFTQMRSEVAHGHVHGNYRTAR